MMFFAWNGFRNTPIDAVRGQKRAIRAECHASGRIGTVWAGECVQDRQQAAPVAWGLVSLKTVPSVAEPPSSGGAVEIALGIGDEASVGPCAIGPGERV